MKNKSSEQDHSLHAPGSGSDKQHPNTPADANERFHQQMQREEENPKHHAELMRKRLLQVVEHLRSDIEKVSEPQFRAMFETAAEVLLGVCKAFEDYQGKKEKAWK